MTLSIFRRKLHFIVLPIALLASSAFAKVVVQTVDEEPGQGRYVSSASGGNVMAYYDAIEGDLKLATCTAECDGEEATWQIVTVDSEDREDSYIGWSLSLQVDSLNRPVISYYDWDNEILKLATCLADCQSEDPNWQIVVVDDGDDENDVGFHSSLQLDTADRPVISYYDFTDEALKLATCLDNCQSNNPSWQIIVVDDSADMGFYSALQLDSQDRPIIAYQNYTQGELALASCTSNCESAQPIWDFSVVDDGEGEYFVSDNVVMDLDSEDRPVIAYSDYDNETLKIASCASNCQNSSSALWNVSTVDSVRTFGYISLKINSQDRPVISYYNSDYFAELKLATCISDCMSDTPQWDLHELYTDYGYFSPMTYASLQMRNDGSAHIAFYANPNEPLSTIRVLAPPEVQYVVTPFGGDYLTGETLEYTVTFDQPVILTGDLSLELSLESGPVLATVQEFGASSFQFSYTLQEGDRDESESGLVPTALVLSEGGTVRDYFDNDALLALNNVTDYWVVKANLRAYDVTFVVGGRGTIEPAEAQSVLAGETASFTLVAETGFETIVSGGCDTIVEQADVEGSYTLTTSATWAHCEFAVGFVSEQSLAFEIDDEYSITNTLPYINAAPAYERGITGRGVVAGVIDTSIYKESLEFYGSNIDGYDFVNDTDNLLVSSHAHGTQVSSLVAGRRNGLGMHGVAYEADIMFAVGLKSNTLVGNGFAAAYDFMRENGVRIVNNSYGLGPTITGEHGFSSRLSLQSFLDLAGYAQGIAALSNALSEDMIMVFSAGNDNYDQVGLLAGLPYFYPELPANIIAVAALDANSEDVAAFSNHCGVAASWCVAAQGQNLTSASYSTYNSHRMKSSLFSGTSGSAPLVTGLGTLLLEQFPWMSGTQIVSTILTTASNGTDEVLSEVTGRGTIDVGKAIDGPAAFEFEFEADTQGSDAEFANDISGTGSLTKTGLGMLTLSGTNTYSGTTKVEDGELRISGSLSGDTTVSGGTLSGNAQLARLTATGGTLSPGEGIGTISATYLFLTSTATLQFDLQAPDSNSDVSNDLIEINGNAIINGELVITNPNNLTPGTYTLITYSGGVTDRGLELPTIPGLTLSTSKGNGSIRLVADATLSVDSNTNNTGTLNSPYVTETGSITGGTLTGVIRNNGTISDISLASGAVISGGVLSGVISGDANNPARIDNANIVSGTRLQNVLIGADTVMDASVELGANVRFESDENIPAGIDLTASLATLVWDSGDARTVVQLDDDILSTSGISTPSVLSGMQSLLAAIGVDSSQDSNGEFVLEAGGLRAALVPVQVSMAGASDVTGLSISRDGEIVLVTSNGRVITSHPAMQAPDELAAILAGFGLALGYDERANLVMSPTEEADTYYIARPDALAMTSSEELGAYARAIPGVTGVVQLYVVFDHGAGDTLEQALVAQPLDWPLLKSSLVDLGMTDAQIDLQGIVSFVDNGVTNRGLADYLVTQGFTEEAVTDQVVLSNAGDLNNDGTDDSWMIFPNGDRQALYLLP